MPNPIPQSKLEVINQVLLALGADELSSTIRGLTPAA